MSPNALMRLFELVHCGTSVIYVFNLSVVFFFARTRTG